MSKFWSALIAIIVVIVFIVAFRSLIVTDPVVSDAFRGLMSVLPFAEPLSELICNLLEFQHGETLVSSSGFLRDVGLLMVMSCLLPPVTALASVLLLRIPANLTNVYDRETYMNRFAYRLTELAIQVALAPLLAILSGLLMDAILIWASMRFGNVGAFIFGLLSTILAAGVSAIPMMLFGTTVSVALLWRFLSTLLGGVLSTLAISACSIALYYAILNDQSEYAIGSLFAMFFLLVIIDVVIQWIQRTIAGYSLRRR